MSIRAKVLVGIVLVAGVIASCASSRNDTPVETTSTTTTSSEAPAQAPVETTLALPGETFDRVVVIGDSLAEEAENFIRLGTSDKEFVRKFYGGTAPCDWLDVDLEATPTTVVAITFLGNDVTSCMVDDPRSVVDKYRADVGALIERAQAAGAWVVLVGQPILAPAWESDLKIAGLNSMYQEYASLPRVSFVDAGQFVENPDGSYTDRLPCAEFDLECGEDGNVVVRGDGAHFCPMAYLSPCPVWSGGAFRFAMGIASAINSPESFD